MHEALVCGRYSARAALQKMRARRQVCRTKRILLHDSEHFELATHILRERLSPEQITGKLRSMNIFSLREVYACRETIFNVIYALPAGELRKALIICLRQSKAALSRRGSVRSAPPK
jgi:IS30 family transposase